MPRVPCLVLPAVCVADAKKAAGEPHLPAQPRMTTARVASPLPMPSRAAQAFGVSPARSAMPPRSAPAVLTSLAPAGQAGSTAWSLPPPPDKAVAN